ncbi:MAG: sigma 54-interacting transcriptional regulator [Desulfobulbaceae bacterium]|nr:sigma 54-interacting transcriptional regulator [Desulfobulbaceae bacterium]
MLHLLECSPIAQFAINMDHKITVWNKACELLTGFSAAEMIGTDRQWEAFYSHKRPVVADLIVDNDFEQFIRYYESKNGQRSSIVPNAWEASSYFPSLGGQSRYIYFLAAPIVDNLGKMIGAVETLQDFTRQKQLETFLKEESDKLRQENITLKSAMTERYRFGDIIGKSDAMQEVYELVANAASSDSNVIVYGESGTGKELVARAIHQMSDRRDRDFVLVNCGAIPETLLESEFFGYRKGAFTGAHADKPGFLDRADGGTLFLDEVGDVSLNMQVKLLRAIDGGGYSPLGSSQTKTPNIRIIAATNRDLEELIDKGLVREDFYYRIHIIPINLPPLRDRKEDLPLLIDHFLRRYGSHDKISGIPGKVYGALQNYNWPGNVRELQNVLRRYLALNRLDFSRKFTPAGPEAVIEPEGKEIHTPQQLRRAVEDFEKNCILTALNGSRWHKSQAAALLGISRKTLFRKIKQFDIK